MAIIKGNILKKIINKGNIKKVQKKAYNEINDTLDKKEDRIRAYRKEASRLSSMANKRIGRLEKANLQDSPAYKNWIDKGSVRFGVKGKDHNELQREVARLRNFIGSESSTIGGINRTLKEMADNTGIKYSTMKELRQSSGQFFELASKVDQYLRTVEDMASSIGYQKIWEQINKYVKKNKIRLDSSENNIEELTRKVTESMDIYNESERINVSSEGGGIDYSIEGWYQLKKD